MRTQKGFLKDITPEMSNLGDETPEIEDIANFYQTERFNSWYNGKQNAVQYLQPEKSMKLKEDETRYSNMDEEFAKMHDPSWLDVEDSEVLLESPKGSVMSSSEFK